MSDSSRHTGGNTTSRSRRRGYRGLSAEELRKQRHQRLISAGTALFGERGYAATPIEAVCSQAKVSTRHFYEQFGGRESILHAVYDALVAEMESIIRNSLTSGRETLTQRVADTIESSVFFLLDDPRRGRIVCIEAVGVSEAMEKKRRETTHALAEIIRRYAELMADAGTLPQRDYRLPAVALVGMFNELVAEWLTEQTGLSAAEMAREAKILFRAMIFGAQHYEATDGSAPPLDENSA
ncbi:TetR/AcrR family transcriptional regulator [Salinisphaera sp. Q1T1-3]|uniref:TetR/AcrR family transcriptional regulator n=1 Tax=Salinisphaera sp. Q1T1-3 TaxID=2321229 RepID=UPI000E72FBFF|nr:helix-turn-helix domain-containing protein [Salinisphaera sp. Q1T1-3]RJS91957.1 TetR/AcrR family transcriptional regulator [Salinisphaera sp. Q1T1-3]